MKNLTTCFDSSRSRSCYDWCELISVHKSRGLKQNVSIMSSFIRPMLWLLWTNHEVWCKSYQSWVVLLPKSIKVINTGCPIFSRNTLKRDCTKSYHCICMWFTPLNDKTLTFCVSKYEACRTKTLCFMRVQKKNLQNSKMPKSEQFDINVNFSNCQKARSKRKQTKCFSWLMIN